MYIIFGCFGRVAPFVGAWIEINYAAGADFWNDVAPFVGAWIEIVVLMSSFNSVNVAPFVGAWIEIQREREAKSRLRRRSVRRSVD